ncbi:16S rRNA (guanine(966)-N(2))-methyltransferase RsmD [Paenibacillus sp. MBLB4367]|uniref:16S rRNA (guanine(966)-N(2))-methyltransferase RsmD n=1 Tax=Paenibacillus sp. MBLB4367 TaxID=3384767 RepID=UPI003907F895
MRVISGTAKGRPLKAVPGTGTRPTTDKVKEAIFSMIGPYFSGGWVLDLFAGTGGLGIEALSRGMDRAIFIDMEKKSVEVVNDNLRATNLQERAEVFRNEAGRAVKALAKRKARFELVFLDPPYRLKIAEDLMRSLQELALLDDRATIVVEHDAEHRYEEEVGDCVCIRRAEYGETVISIYRYEPKADNDLSSTQGQELDQP